MNDTGLIIDSDGYRRLLIGHNKLLLETGFWLERAKKE